MAAKGYQDMIKNFWVIDSILRSRSNNGVLAAPDITNLFDHRQDRLFVKLVRIPIARLGVDDYQVKSK